MNATGQPPNLVQCLPQRLNAPVEHVRCVWIGALECLCLGELQREQKRHELLLGPIVKISLQAAALAIAGLDQTRPGLPNLIELTSHLNLKAGVLEGQTHHDRPPVGAAAEPVGVDAKPVPEAPACCRNKPGDRHRLGCAQSPNCTDFASRRLGAHAATLGIEHPHRKGERLPAEVTRISRPVPALRNLLQRLTHFFAEFEPFRHPCADLAVGGHPANPDRLAPYGQHREQPNSVDQG